MRKPVNIESAEDIVFLTRLAAKMEARENQRKEGKSVYSPSALASCLRHVYLLRHSQELEIPRRPQPRMESNFYFLKGNFTHIQWQFVLHKMMQAGVEGIEPLLLDEVEPKWCEFRVMSKRGDHGGTVDVGVKIFGEPMFVDVKGVNTRTFGEAVRGYAPSEYTLQLGDYMSLHNSKAPRQRIQEDDHLTIKRSLLLFENKGGPDNRHPIALHETVVKLKQQRPEVRRRLEVLRDSEERKEIPPPECTSTATFQFGGCPFRNFCREEVKKIEARRRKADSKQTAYQVARPSRTARRRR